MPKILDQWTVYPHGPLRQVDDGIWTADGDIPMPLGNFPRRMTVVRLRHGRLAIWSAIALREPDMAAIEADGTPAFLIVPGPGHRLDARIWKQRYPALRVVAPPGAAAAVREAVPVDATTDILDDPDTDFAPVGGTADREAALTIRRPGGTTIVCNDVIAHVRHPHGLGARVMARLMRFGASGPRVPRPVERMMIDDKPALAAQFRDWARIPDLRRVIMSHGDPIEDDPASALDHLARRLTA